ncbi:hypothetical protein LZZ85_20835 [Terrimonas sp. NA20]|uniref:DUF3857 domain-containing protein n=1 Tax=Terrimonas ginsenosidimutans TaxID=2908004 RepID=A0ABS9KWS4_9BACT|nr:hypothetical protein [Terrimonas ginsenosidimutans]MCG2616758.1 hypothetical protein [Terrimonas ginsenosidimutans]
MGKYLVSLMLLFPLAVFSQSSTDKLARAFPITDYIVDLNDSFKLVQVYVDQSGLIIDKQVGLLKSAYEPGITRPDEIGVGRCQLIKENYYYFAINVKASGAQPKPGDLLYVTVPKPTVFLERLVRIAALSITLTDVYGKPVYDLATIFNSWTESNERAAMDSMIRDVKFTADYFLKNDPSMNVKIKTGLDQGKLIFDVMKAGTVKELSTFLDYIRGHPQLYAGKEWKISEIFATWLREGSPRP